MDASQIKKKIDRFRILIIGRANAGKTTILQRVCNTRNNPEIFNSAGEKIDATVLTASRERGEHNIENEMVFNNNPGFVFHDSRGFEAGSGSEFDKVNAFIEDRAKRTGLKDRIHTIWYCIPMDEASRSFTEGEVKFFSRCDTGSIPVIVLFTKFDAFYDVEYARLRENGVSRKDAKELAPFYAEETFANGPQLKVLYNSKDIQRPPKCHVCLPNMDKDDSDCGPLIECTARTLDNAVLKQLFVSTQQTNMELCMKSAIEHTLESFIGSDKKISFEDTIATLGSWFPHIRPHHEYHMDGGFHGEDARTFHIYERHRGEGEEAELNTNLGLGNMKRTDDLEDYQRREIQSRILSVASGSSLLETTAQLSSAVVIVFEHSFYIFDQRLHRWDSQRATPSFYVALEKYMASRHAAAVKQAVSTAVQVYQEAASTANSSTWKGKLPFGRSQRKAKQRERMAELIKTIFEVTLQHRLPRR